MGNLAFGKVQMERRNDLVWDNFIIVQLDPVAHVASLFKSCPVPTAKAKWFVLGM